MVTFLDLLVVVSMVLMASSFLSLLLMFLVKNKKVQRVCFYISVALSLYVSYVGFRINGLGFFEQAILAVLLGLVSIGAVVLERVKKNDDKMFLTARLATLGALVIGLINALMV